MAVTNFDVQPFSVLPGLNAVSQGANVALKREEAEKQRKLKLLQQQQLMKAVESGDPDQIFEYVSNNPGSEKLAGELAGFVSDITRQSAIATAEKVLIEGADPAKAMLEHADLVINQGGDASESLGITEAVLRDPSVANKQALATIALHAPEKYQAYKEAIAEPQSEYTNITEMAGGQMAGLNKATGQFEIIPSSGIDFEGKGTPTELGKLFDLQDSLPANDPRRAQVDAAIQKATGADVGSALIPEALTDGLSEQVAAKAAAAFEAAGGGKDGIEAFVKVVDKATEQEKRVLMPKLLNDSFPSASEEEFRELEAAALSGKTVEAGLNSARNVRGEQRRLKKAKEFQDRAVELLNKILASDQVGDVTGSVEGAYDFRFSDPEAELIADIDEAQNILTADNMDLMTGVLSESDIKLLKNLSSGGLNRKRSKKRFLQDVRQMRDRLSSVAVLTTDERAAVSGAKSTPRLIYNPDTGELEQAK